MTNPAARRRPFEILIVENNAGEIRLVEEALKESGFNTQLTIVTDGHAAAQQIRDAGASHHRPDLILLDLHVKDVSGLDILAETKANEQVQAIPIIIFSTSGEPEDVAASYREHANAFVQKPVELEEFLAAVSNIESFWISTVLLPE